MISLDTRPGEVSEIYDRLNALIVRINASLAGTYGEITIDSNSTATALTTDDTWYQITPGWTSNVIPSGITLDTEAGTMTMGVARVYMMVATVAFTSADGPELVEFGIFVNGTLAPDHFALTWLDTETFPNTVTMSGIEPLVAGDVVDLRVRCTTASGKSLTVIGANFSVFAVGAA